MSGISEGTSGDGAAGAGEDAGAAGNAGGEPPPEPLARSGSTAVVDRTLADELAPLAITTTILGGAASVATAWDVWGPKQAIIILACTVLLILVTLFRTQKFKTGKRPIYLLSIAVLTVAAAILGIIIVPEPPIPPSPPPVAKRNLIEIEPLKDPGVKLVAEARTDTLVKYAWEILKPLPKGMVARFPAASDPITDANNPHPEYYPWDELTANGVGDKGDKGADTAPAKFTIGMILYVQIYAVDAACAEELRAGSMRAQKLCLHGKSQPDSDAIKVTVMKK